MRTSKFGVEIKTIRGRKVPKTICGNMWNDGPFKCSTLQIGRSAIAKERKETLALESTSRNGEDFVSGCDLQLQRNDRLEPLQPPIMLLQPSLPDLTL